MNPPIQPGKLASDIADATAKAKATMNPPIQPGKLASDIADATAKAAPPLGMSTWHYLLGLPVEKWVAIATFVYVTLQIAALVRKEFIKRGGKRK